MKFKSKKQLAKALLSGRKFIYQDVMKNEVYFDKSNMTFRCKSDGSSNSAVIDGLWAFYNQDVWEEIIKPQWFDNIPSHGVLCEVWDSDGETSTVELIRRYHPTETYKYESDRCGWRHAEPLSKKNVKEWLFS